MTERDIAADLRVASRYRQVASILRGASEELDELINDDEGPSARWLSWPRRTIDDAALTLELRAEKIDSDCASRTLTDALANEHGEEE